MDGITWFGNVYQKFETMCLEVEEAVCQDTVKYVENQMQTVGASVKKFYSEVVDDLLSPSLMDPVKVNSLSCTGAHKKPKLGIKEEPKKQLFEDRNATTKNDGNPIYAPSFDRFSNADPAVPCHPVSSTIESKSNGVSSKKVNLFIKRKPKTMIPNSSEVPRGTNPSAAHLHKGALKLKNENIEAPTDQIFGQQLDPDAVHLDLKEAGEKITYDGNQESFNLNPIADASVKPSKIIVSGDTGSFHSNESLENEEGLKSMPPVVVVNDLTNVPCLGTSSDPNDAHAKNKDASGFNISCSEEWTVHSEETDGWNIETITSDDDGFEEGTEIMDISFENHTVLEESCIFVDRDNLPFCSHKEPKHKSYKKQLREAFLSRGKSTIKKEYIQLAAKYKSATNVELDQHSASSSLHTPMPTSEKSKLKSSAQLCESEWEIL